MKKFIGYSFFLLILSMPCKILVPIFKKLAEEFKDIKFIKVDVDDNDDELSSIINDLKIVAVPSFLFYHNNKLVERLAGGNAVVLRLNAEKLSAREETDSKNAKETGEETKPNEKKEVEEGKMETGAEANEEEKEKDETAEAPKEDENEEPVVEKKEEEKQETEEKKAENKEETKETQNEVEPKKEAENDPKETQKESDKPVESNNE
jgi:thiol-disulfide isomerase/thioredoxin